jgi:hypothetical protein
MNVETTARRPELDLADVQGSLTLRGRTPRPPRGRALQGENASEQDDRPGPAGLVPILCRRAVIRLSIRWVHAQRAPWRTATGGVWYAG